MAEIDPYWRNIIMQLRLEVDTLKKFGAKSSWVIDDTNWFDIGSVAWNFSYIWTDGHQQKVELTGAINHTVDIDCADWFFDLQVTQSGTGWLFFTASNMTGWRIFNGSFLDWYIYPAWVHNFVWSSEGGYANIYYTWPAV